MLDDDKFANRKRADMNKRLDKIYEDMDSVESERIDCLNRLEAVQEQQLNEKKIYQMLLEFDRIYDKLSLEEQRNVLHALISEIQLYKKDEIKESKTYIKNIGEILDKEGNHVETVCLLSKLNVEHHIEVELDMDEMDLTAAESKATYEEIKDYVLEHSGLKVSNLYIAQVKQKYGIIKRVNYNKPNSEDTKRPKCPLGKEKAIEEALRHFSMI